MDLLIRLLVISFPFVFSGALFWPVIEDRLKEPALIVEQSKQVDYLALPEEQDVSTSRQVEPARQPSAGRSVKVSDSGIYRWVDESGNVGFSDRPINQDAVVHKPIEIGYVEVSGELKRHISKQAVQVRTAQAGGAPAQSASTGYRVASSSRVAGYEFSRTSAGQKHGYVLLSGRISSGPKCKKLMVYASARSDRGKTVSSRDETSYNGFGSTLFEMKPHSRWNGSGRRPQWEITRASASCVE